MKRLTNRLICDAGLEVDTCEDTHKDSGDRSGCSVSSVGNGAANTSLLALLMFGIGFAALRFGRKRS